jgi:phospholipase/carboxylesterase
VDQTGASWNQIASWLKQLACLHPTASSVNPHTARTRPAAVTSVMAAALAVTVLGCGRAGRQVTRVEARPVAPTLTIGAGEHPLGMGTIRLRDAAKRDGRLYVPRQAAPQRPLPLIVLLHGGGGRAQDFRSTFPLAEEFGVVMLALDSRHNTWDGIDSPFGPDVQFIDAALRYTFERVAVDRERIAIGGLSDGGAYALSLGLVNGDLFTHLVAVAPGFFAPPAPPTGRPRIFVAHGTRDNVYSVAGSRRDIVPRLKSAGYDVTYYEFDGPHWVTEAAAREALKWLVH